jgi:hypothetical protein
MAVQKAANIEDCRHDRWGTIPRCCTQMRLDVLLAMCLLAGPRREIIPTTIKNCSVKCGFLIAVSSNDIAIKLTEDEVDDWHTL